MCLPQAPKNTAAREAAERQAEAEREERAISKREQLENRRGEVRRRRAASLVSMNAAPTGGRSFFRPSSGPSAGAA